MRGGGGRRGPAGQADSQEASQLLGLVFGSEPGSPAHSSSCGKRARRARCLPILLAGSAPLLTPAPQHQGAAATALLFSCPLSSLRWGSLRTLALQVRTCFPAQERKGIRVLVFILVSQVKRSMVGGCGGVTFSCSVLHPVSFPRSREPSSHTPSSLCEVRLQQRARRLNRRKSPSLLLSP